MRKSVINSQHLSKLINLHNVINFQHLSKLISLHNKMLRI